MQELEWNELIDGESEINAEDINKLAEYAKALNINKPDESDVTALLSNKVDKENGKGLSTNDFTDDEKEKLDTIINFINVDGSYLDNEIILNCLKQGNYSRGLNVVRTSIEDGLLLVSLTDYYEAVYIDIFGAITHFESVTADNKDWTEYIAPQYATHSYVDSSIRSAIGDIETSLENIIQKYGLGGDGV